jgi:carbonic anhydrase/acetyltransferase-like protein (isoleucine patch superfamily)
MSIKKQSGDVRPFNGIWPKIHPDAYIAPTAVIIGDVAIGEQASIWDACVLRGDVNYIRIGARTNLQEGTIVHVTTSGWPTVVGEDVTIGHGAMLHACTVGDLAFIGMRATMLDQAVVDERGMLAAGALLSPGKQVATGELWAGMPAKRMRLLAADAAEGFMASAQHYVRLAHAHKTGTHWDKPIPS